MDRIKPPALMQQARNAVRPLVQQLDDAWYHMRALAGGGVLPHFLIIGAQKAGTTALYDALTQHPQVASASRKEVGFFSQHWWRGTAWYRAHFPPLAADQQTGEATPVYLFHPAVPERVARLLPAVRLIVMLREPAARCLSHYFHEVRLGHERLPLAAALAAEPERLAREAGFGYAHRHYSYLARSDYAPQLERWGHFFPQAQLLIVRSEDFFAEPAAQYAQVLDFLGLPPFAAARLRRTNPGVYGEKVADTDLALIQEQLAPARARLATLLPGLVWNGA